MIQQKEGVGSVYSAQYCLCQKLFCVAFILPELLSCVETLKTFGTYVGCKMGSRNPASSIGRSMVDNLISLLPRRSIRF